MVPLFWFGDLLFHVRYAIISAISTVREGILLMRGKVPVLVAGSDSRRFLFEVKEAKLKHGQGTTCGGDRSLDC